MAAFQKEPGREHRLIASIKQWTGESLIGDDCALLPGQRLVTSDMLVEGKHFLLPEIPLADLGWKAMAVNLSDIAAMSGRPEYAVVNICVPSKLSDRQFQQLYSGLIDCARTYKTRIVGGDLTGGDKLVISITVIGTTHQSGCMLRSYAKPGDLVVVSGDFGGSRAGLAMILQGERKLPDARNRHFHPLPRLKESWQLIEACAGKGALMDASDGLADALIQIAGSSGVKLLVEERSIPLHKDTQAAASVSGGSALDLGLYGGEDYELVACISETAWAELQKISNSFKPIGTVEEGKGVFLCEDGKIITELNLNRTFQHW